MAEFIEYTGPANRRSISAAQFKAAGVEGQKDALWSKDNGKRLPTSHLKKEALELLGGDKHFRIVKGD